jgi:hypothetical protein
VPEASRFLRPGGLLAFTAATPLVVLCQDQATDTLGRQLLNDYFGMHCLEWENSIEF